MVDLRKIKGGAKHKYLREHRREILGYLSTHGEYKTLQKYGTTVVTLDRLLRDNSITKNEKASDAEKVMLRVDILQEKVNSLYRDMRALENSFAVPVEELADNIRNHVVVPLLRMTQKPEGLEIRREDKLLDIGSLMEEVGRK